MKTQIDELPEPSETIRIAIIDDQELFRAGIKMLMKERKSFVVVGEAKDRSSALSLVEREQPDVIVLAVESKDSPSFSYLPELLNFSHKSRLLVLTGSHDPELHRGAILLGAMGVLSKDKNPEVLLKAIDRVHAGEAWLDRLMTASVFGEFSPRSKKVDPEERKIASLTDREREVIKHVGEGLKNKAIADKLFISNITVHHHLTSIYSKLEVADRLELLIYAYRNGLAQLPR